MIARILPVLFMLGGCASLNDVVGGIGNAPEWFQERRVQIRGEGYPLLREVPAVDDIDEGFERMAETSVTADVAKQYLENHPRAELSALSEQELLSPFAPMRAQLPDIQPAPEDIISDEELTALLAQLVPPPAR
ncbi:MAG: hypothetical protein AAF683_07660 [Pseudomonadota bacterium]